MVWNRYNSPLVGGAGRGFDAAYEADRKRAERELETTMAGPKEGASHARRGEAKDPEGDLDTPGSSASVKQRRPMRAPVREASEGRQGGALSGGLATEHDRIRPR